MTTTNPLTECESVLEFARAQMGLAFPAQRREDALRVVDRVLSAAGVKHADRYCARVQSNGRDYDEFVSALTVGETYFFRESAHFDFVRQSVIPPLSLRPASQGPLRVWSAGCSTGEEAYSLAITFADAGLADRTHILATDLSRVALARAEAGRYREWSLRGEAVARAGRWLRPQGETVEVDGRLQRMITWQYLNLALDAYPAFATRTWACDLIFCRNVLIYFNPETVRRVAEQMFAALAPGGWLVTASSDPSLTPMAPWQTEVTSHGVFYQRPATDERAAIAPGSVESLPGVFETHPRFGGHPRDDAADSRPVPWESRLTPASPGPSGDDADPPVDDLTRCLERVLQLANQCNTRAEEFCAESIARYPLSADLHVLHAILLEELNRTDAAVGAARRAVYLDRMLAMGHFTLGVSLQRQGEKAEARRAFRNARDLCRTHPEKTSGPLAKAETAERLAAAAEAQLAILNSCVEDDAVSDPTNPSFSGARKTIAHGGATTQS